jgi:putative transposase
VAHDYRQKPPRLGEILQAYCSPVYFVTFCTMYRRSILANETVHTALRDYGLRGANERKVALGRYVIMPDHVHLFVGGGDDFVLGLWVRGLKRALANAVVVAVVSAAGNDGAPGTGAATPKRIWQPGFFDHLLRNSESYAEKWNYFRENPVRKGLVTQTDDWPYQGEMVVIDRV